MNLTILTPPKFSGIRFHEILRVPPQCQEIAWPHQGILMVKVSLHFGRLVLEVWKNQFLSWLRVENGEIG